MRWTVNIIRIRKVHRYLGLVIGLQLFLWALGGLYFTWTDLSNIHGDHFIKSPTQTKYFTDLMPLNQLNLGKGINSIELRNIEDIPYYWINNQYLINAQTGVNKSGITEKEARWIVKTTIQDNFKIKDIEWIDHVDRHNEYRNKPLPAYKVSFQETPNLVAYVSVKDGKFQTVRHRSWRIFDFLWMMHTMDYSARDNFNNTLIRIFAFLGLITVLSGFLLFFTVQRWK